MLASEKRYCYNCRAENMTRIRMVGASYFRQCVECGLWIRCATCHHIEATEGHMCPERTIAT